MTIITLILFIIIIISVFISITFIQKSEDENEDAFPLNYTSSDNFIQLKKLLEDCSLINKDFAIVSFEIQKVSKGFLKFSIRFLDLGMCVIVPNKNNLENVEQKINADYEVELNNQRNMDMLESVRKQMNKVSHFRSIHQNEADSYFFEALFKDYPFDSREIVIKSPFEYYESSNGTYIIDTDHWKIEGDDAIYTDLLKFDDNQYQNISYIIEKIAKEIFPNVKIKKIPNGCFINIPR